MAREPKSAEEIWMEVDAQVVQRMHGYADPTIYLPLPVALPAPDASGCNWTMAAQCADAPVRLLIEAAVQAVRLRFNLAVDREARRLATPATGWSSRWSEPSTAESGRGS